MVAVDTPTQRLATHSVRGERVAGALEYMYCNLVCGWCGLATTMAFSLVQWLSCMPVAAVSDGSTYEQACKHKPASGRHEGRKRQCG